MNLAKSDKRQKVVLILLIAVGVFLVWQLYELFVGDKPSQNTIKPVLPTPIQAHQPAMAVTASTTAAQLAQSGAGAANPAEASAAVNPSNSQSEYLRLVNEYQMAQLQRMIAEDNEAIAIAKQNAAKATTETSKLMGGGSVMSTTGSSQANSNEYQLVYTGQQTDGGWSATLKKNGQSTDVNIGSQLADGSQVISIDDNGVLLRQGDVKKLVTFSGVTKMVTAPNNAASGVEAVKSSVNESANLPKLAPTTVPVKSMQTAPVSVATKPVLPPVPGMQKSEKAEKSEAALIAKPDSLAVASAKMVPEKKTVDERHVNVVAVTTAKPVSVGVLPAAKPTPISNNAAVIELPGTAKKERASLPLEQSMVAFPNLTKSPSGAKVTAEKAPSPVAVTSVDDKIPTQILSANPNYYTIQLTSDHKLANVQEFITEYDLQGKANYFRTYDMKNRELYILIYGQFANVADAKAALAKLPASAKEEGAFLVKFSTIQTVLKKVASAK